MYEYLGYLIVPLITFQYSNIVKVLFDVLVRTFFYTVTFSNKHLSRGIDRFIMDSSKDNLINYGNNKTPMVTWHFRWFHGPLILVKTDCSDYEGDAASYTYMAYGTKKGIETIVKMSEEQDFDEMDGHEQVEDVPVEKNPNDPKDDDVDEEVETVKAKSKSYKIDVAYFDSPAPYRSNFTRRKIYPPNVTPFQSQEEISSIITKEFVDRVHKPFIEQPKKRVGSLFLGKHGVGKSDTAKFIATKLQGYGMKPVIVYGYDLTAPGITLEDVWEIHASKDNPVILVFNEFDKACEFADKNEPNAKGYRALAHNKTAMDDLLDRLESEPYMIMILTSNRDIDYFLEHYPAYVRQGRIDYSFTMTRSKVIEHPLLVEQ